MDIRILKIFSHLASSLHFGRTSRACNISPSALSRTIQRLEDEVGKPLFIRNNRSVFLTPAGDLFKHYAEESVQRWHELQNQLAEDEVLQGELSLYCSVTAAHSILPHILGQFRKTHPAIQIKLQTGDAAMALLKLQNSDADVTIAALPDKLPPGIEFIEMFTTPLVFIAPVEFPEPLVSSNNAIDWQQTPVIMAEHGLSRVRIDEWFKQKQITPNIYAQVAGNEAIITMVSLGCGIGVVPRLVLEKSPLWDQVKIIEVTPALTPFTIGVCTAIKHMVNPIVRTFWATVSQKRIDTAAKS